MASIITDSYEFLVDTTLEAQWEDQVLPSVRRIYRHSSNEGSVIEFDYWGAKKKLFVADAKYRGSNLAYDTTDRSQPHILMDLGMIRLWHYRTPKMTRGFRALILN